MTVLSIPLVVQLAAACHAPGVSVQRVVAHAIVESGLSTLAIHDNTADRTYAPTTRAEAVALTSRLIAAKHSVDAGLLQLNSANFQRLGLTIDRVFDPQINTCGGAVILAQAYDAERRISCRYNAGIPDCHSDYPERIARVMAQLRNDGIERLPDAATGSDEQQQPPPTCQRSADVWDYDPCAAADHDFFVQHYGDTQ